MENQEKQYKRLIASLEGLELTESETSTLEWLSGWDYIAINDIISLFKKCTFYRILVFPIFHRFCSRL